MHLRIASSKFSARHQLSRWRKSANGALQGQRSSVSVDTFVVSEGVSASVVSGSVGSRQQAARKNDAPAMVTIKTMGQERVELALTVASFCGADNAAPLRRIPRLIEMQI